MAKRIKTDPNTTIAYIRVSTEEQANEGVSLSAQEARINAYCSMRGLDLLDVVVDAGVSAGKPLSTREGGQRVLEALRSRKARTVVAFKLDRLFRNAADCLTVIDTWDRGGVALHLVDIGGQAVDTSSAMGRFFLTMMAGVAEMERNQIRERTSMAMQHMIARGNYTGGAARYGWSLGSDRKLVPVPDELKTIAEIRDLRASGLSLRRIAGELAARGIVSRAGLPFVPGQVAKLAAIGYPRF